MNAPTETATRPIDTIAAHLTTTRFEDIDRAAVELAKRRVLDVIGCALGGANIDGNPELLDLLRTWGGAGQATIIGHGGKLPVHHAAFLNSIMARSNDLEVMTFIHEGARVPSHNAGSTVPTALALAEANGRSGRELLAALVLGDDLVARVSLASNWSFTQGFDGIGSLVPWGTTAVAGRLLGLDDRQQIHAFGLMLNMMSGTVQDYWDGVHAFKLVQGTPAQQGVLAAELAKRGWTGNYDPLFADYGYFKLFAQGAKDPDILTKGLGEHYFGEAVFKHFPSGLPTHTPIACALKLYHEHGVRAEGIESVEIAVTEQSMTNYYAKPFRLREWPHGDAAFSYQYTTCMALLRGDFFVDDMTESAITAQPILDLVAKSRVVPMQSDHRYGSTVTVRLKDGRVEREFLGAMPGDPLTDPATDEFIIDKFRRQAAFNGTLREDRVEELIERVLRLDEIDDIGEITALAVA